MRKLPFCFLILFTLRLSAQLSPGPLSKVHSGLEGATKCTSCHSFGLGARKFRCVGCHVEIGQRISANRGFHARVVKSQSGSQDCVRCHTDHFGPKFNIVKWEPSHDEFDHRQTGYALIGKHAQVSCESCHQAKHVLATERATIRVKDPNHTYLGLSTQCASCHVDEHRGQLDQNCSRCHSFQSWKPAAEFNHEQTAYPLTGLHQRVTCAQCHKSHTEAGKAYAQYKGVPFASCSGCHADPHKGSFQGGCQSCHTTSGWQQVSGLSSFDHGRTAFPLHGAHATTTCARCHTGPNFKQPVAHAQCANCHSPDPHGGQFPGQDCASCHNEDHFKPSTFSVSQHQQTLYPLMGKHAAVNCGDCHIPAAAATRYHVKNDACQDCHKDSHSGQFATAPYADRCDSCHTVNGFRPSTFTLARHQEGRFHLSGAHAATPCADCHKPPAGSIPPGPAQFKFQALACGACHQDQHQGQFAGPAKQDCETCHKVSSWRDVTAFEHSTTQFELRGAHRAVGCAECHRPANLSTSTRQIVFRGAPTACSGCHEDVHGGQFAKAATQQDCTSCHTATSWKPSTFDHETRASFPLKGAHQEVACRQCHTEKQERQGREVVVYGLTPSRCKACHSDQ